MIIMLLVLDYSVVCDYCHLILVLLLLFVICSTARQEARIVLFIPLCTLLESPSSCLNTFWGISPEVRVRVHS